MISFRVLSFVALAGAGLTSLAFAQSFDISFNRGGLDPTPSGPAAVGSAGDQWNAFNGNAVPSGSLIDTGGNPTNAVIQFTSQGAVESLNTGTQPVPALTDFYLFNNSSGDILAEIDGLTAFQTYDVALYVASDDAAGGDRSVQVSVGGNSVTIVSATGDPASTFTNGVNVLLLPMAASSAGNIIIDESMGATNTSGEVDLNGIQLQSVPEPGPLAALGLGVIGLLRRRNRRA